MIQTGTPAGIVIEWVLPSLAFLGLLTLATGRGRTALSLLERDRTIVAMWLISRPLYAVVLWCILGNGLSEDMWVWKAFTNKMAAGQVPGRDFTNLYGPLLPYLQFLGRWLTPNDHHVGTLWVFLAGDALAVFAGGRLAESIYGKRAGVFVRVWLLVDPSLWHQLIVRAQDEPLFLGILVGSALLAERRRPCAAAALLAVGFCATKITFAPYAAAVLLSFHGTDKIPWKPWAFFAAIVCAVFAAYAATGAPWLFHPSSSVHSIHFGVGMSIPDAVARVFPALPRTPALLLYASGSLAGVLWVWSRARTLPEGRRTVVLIAVAHAVSMLLMPFSVTTYVTQGVAFALLVFLSEELPEDWRRAGLVAVALVSFLSAMYWTRSRAFSIPMKPVCITFHLLLLASAWRLASPRVAAGARA